MYICVNCINNRAENTSIKKLKKQQEQALAETVQRKDEVLKYLENERQRTLTWCAEQRSEIEKEKRASAKQVNLAWLYNISLTL